MNIRFITKQVEINPDVRTYCEKRLRSINKLLRPPAEVDIVFSHEKYRYKIEINLKAKGIVVVTEDESPDLMVSLGKVFDSLEKRIKREKEKIREKKRRVAREKRQKSLSSETQFGAEEEKRVIRMNDYSLKPMTVEEAIIQLDLKRRDVFVFRRENNEKFAVIFKRRDGHYGLIEPE